MKIRITIDMDDAGYDSIRFFDACKQAADCLSDIGRDVLDNDKVEAVKGTTQSIYDLEQYGADKIGEIRIGR